MEEWLKQNGALLGNAILSSVGLAFAIGAPVKVKFRNAKKWWICLWSGFVAFYLFQSIFAALLFVTLTANLLLITLAAISNGVSASAGAMIYLYVGNKEQPNTQKSIIVFLFVFLLSVSGVLLSSVFYIPRNLTDIISVYILNWIIFVLIAWNYRKQHMATTLLLLAYANLQLPVGLINKGGFGNDLILLLVAKLSLIGAMYHTLGIRDAKSKAI